MKQVVTTLLLGLSLCAAQIFGGTIVLDPHYPLKQRNRRTETLKLFSQQAIKEIGLSWSDDSDPKSLEAFSINLFSTDGNLPVDPSIISVQEALDRFLLDEINSKYGWGNQVKTVRSRIVTQSSSASSRRFVRELQTTGSTLETLVDVVFRHEPSPVVSDVEAKVNSIMSGDLFYFLSNLTLVSSGDPELANVDSVYYLGKGVASSSFTSSAPTATPGQRQSQNDVKEPIAVENSEEKTSDAGIQYHVIVPVAVASCLMIVAVAVFTDMRRRKHGAITHAADSASAPSARELLETDTGTNLFWDGESDIFSVEAAFVESPRKNSRGAHTQERQPSLQIMHGNQDTDTSTSPRDILSPKNHNDNVSIDQSDIFSGIDAETATSMVTSVEESPRSGRFESRSVFSFLSGFASRGEASTVVHSNVSKRQYSPNSIGTGPRETSPVASDSILGIRASGAHGVTSDGGTPRSRVSSLFTFSEEDSADLQSSGDEKDNPEPVTTKSQFTEDISNYAQPKSPISAQLSQIPEEEKQEEQEESLLIILPRTSSNISQSKTNSSSGTDIVANESGDSLNKSNTVNKNDLISVLNINTVDSSPKESGCFHKVPLNDGIERLEKKSKWRLLLSPFKQEGNEDKAFPTSPKSMISMHDSSSLVLDEGYNTDPGPSGVKRTTHRKSEAIRRPWHVISQSQSESQAKLWESNKTPLNEDNSTPHEDSLSIHSSHSRWTGEDPFGANRIRRHTKNSTGDGTNKYQNETMGDWSLAEYTYEQDGSMNDPETTFKRHRTVEVTQIEVSSFKKSQHSDKPSIVLKSPSYRMSPGVTPKSAGNESTLSGLSGNSVSAISESSSNKQLISDLVWLEKKINATTNTVVQSPRHTEGPSTVKRDPDDDLDHSDSMSFNSTEAASANRSTDSRSKGSSGSNASQHVQSLKSPPSKQHEMVHSIICRDCYAPPGKLKIVIHSTKDGPAVHTVKKGSSLEGHIFPGDLIISVDNVDTRSYSAEQVMKMMTAKTRFERKITVLHFEQSEAK